MIGGSGLIGHPVFIERSLQDSMAYTAESARKARIRAPSQGAGSEASKEPVPVAVGGGCAAGCGGCAARACGLIEAQDPHRPEIPTYLPRLAGRRKATRLVRFIVVGSLGDPREADGEAYMAPSGGLFERDQGQSGYLHRLLGRDERGRGRGRMPPIPALRPGRARPECAEQRPRTYAAPGLPFTGQCTAPSPP